MSKARDRRNQFVCGTYCFLGSRPPLVDHSPLSHSRLPFDGMSPQVVNGVLFSAVLISRRIYQKSHRPLSVCFVSEILVADSRSSRVPAKQSIQLEWLAMLWWGYKARCQIALEHGKIRYNRGTCDCSQRMSGTLF